MHAYVFSLPQVFLTCTLPVTSHCVHPSTPHILFCILSMTQADINSDLGPPITVSKRAIPFNEDRFIYAKYGNETAEGGKL